MKMKKNTILKVVGLLSITFIGLISAQSINDNEKIGKSYKDISSFGLNQFVNMDLGLIGYFPKKEDWRLINEKIKFENLLECQLTTNSNRNTLACPTLILCRF